jgi:hypothetical protein
MPYQYVREPLTTDESDRLSNACETPTERLLVWTLLDTGIRVGELCDLTSKKLFSAPMLPEPPDRRCPAIETTEGEPRKNRVGQQYA